MSKYSSLRQIFAKLSFKVIQGHAKSNTLENFQILSDQDKYVAQPWCPVTSGSVVATYCEMQEVRPFSGRIFSCWHDFKLDMKSLIDS